MTISIGKFEGATLATYGEGATPLYFFTESGNKNGKEALNARRFCKQMASHFAIPIRGEAFLVAPALIFVKPTDALRIMELYRKVKEMNSLFHQVDRLAA